MISQAARFELKASGVIREIRLLFSGDSSTGTARVRLFGFEGGGTAPFIEHDLTNPLNVATTKPGLKWVTLTLPKPVDIDQRQLFVAVDRISPGLVLVTDSDVKQVCCEDGPESFRYQYIKTDDGRWRSTTHGFAIEIIVTYDHDPLEKWLTDVTEKVGLIDTSQALGGIAWSDYDGDSRLDLLVNGRLYKNNEESFEDVTHEVGLDGRPKASLFIDANNDTRPDILFLGLTNNNDASLSTLYLSREDGTFERIMIEIPSVTNPTSFSVADANMDGYLDVFVGQGTDQKKRPLPNLLLVNNKNLGFVDRAEELLQAVNEPKQSQGSQWADIDHDGLLDLYIVNSGPGASEVWRAIGDGSYTPLLHSTEAETGKFPSMNTLGGDWNDADGDGALDLLSPQHVTLKSIQGDATRIKSIGLSRETTNEERDFREDYTQGLEFSERLGSGLWADVDNDGASDIFLSTTSACRNAHLYVQTHNGSFVSASSIFGLMHVSAGPDAVWVDYDNDGKLDLSTFVNGHFRLFKNVIENANSWVALDVSGQDPIGMTAEVYIDGQKIRRDVTSGRGLLMQDPLRLHFGVGPSDVIDSVALVMRDGGIVMFKDIKINSLNKLSRPMGEISADRALTNASAYPNPFDAKVSFSFSLTMKTEVTIDIFDVRGNLIANPLHQLMNAGKYEVDWDATDAAGNRLSQGVYVYRIKAGESKHVGRIIHEN